MSDISAKRSFGIIEALVAISIGLVAWNLKETIALKNGQSKNSVRISYLEIEKDKGGRFTQSDGKIHDVQIKALIDMAAENRSIHREMEKKLDSIAEDVAVLRSRP